MAGIAVDHAVGSAVTDVDGNTFLDFIGGIGVNALGHAHPRVVDAIQRQVARAHVGSLHQRGARRPRRAARRARARAGPAPRAALLGRRRGRRERAAPREEPHEEARVRLLLGRLPRQDAWARSASWARRTRRASARWSRASHLVPYADCYRCPIGSTLPVLRPRLRRRRAQAAQDGGDRQSIAAFIVEPMQGTAGNVVPPDDFLPAVRSLAEGIRRAPHRRRDDHRLRPHRQVVGRRPLGRRPGHRHDRQGVRRRLPALGPPHARRHRAAPSRGASSSGSSSSYGGNPLGAAAGAAALRAIDDEGLVENARVVGAAMLDALRPFVDDYPFVGEVRGRGLFLGLELVRDKKTKEPLVPRRVTRRIFDECVRRGLLTMALRAELPPPAGAHDRPRDGHERRRDPRARCSTPIEARRRVGGVVSVRRFWRHLRALWPGWTILAPLPFFAQAVWAAVARPLSLGERRRPRRRPVSLRRRPADARSSSSASTRSGSSASSTAR